MKKKVKNLNIRVKKSKENLEQIKFLINQWLHIPLFSRKEDGDNNFFNEEKMDTFKKDRYSGIKEVAFDIENLIKNTEECFLIHKRVKPTSRRWRSYLRHVDGIVSEALLWTISSSVGYLLDQTDINKEVSPLFGIQLELFHPDIIFRPSLDEKKANNFLDFCKQILDDIYHMADLVPRIAQDQEDKRSYLELAMEHQELSELRATFLSRVTSVTSQAIEEQEKYNCYANIWTDSRQEFMFYFLKFSRVLDDEEKYKFSEDETLVKKELPGLPLFKEKILSYEEMYKEVLDIPKVKIYEKWLMVDQSPFRNALLHEVKRWSWIFKKHLLDEVVNSLQDMSNFIEDSDKELAEEVEDGDYDNLIRVMRVLLSVREKQPMYDGIFEPMENTIKLLREFEVDIPEKSLQYMVN